VKRFYSASLAGLLLVGVAPVLHAAVVISEFRTRGPGGANDEYVEIWNNGASAVAIGGWTLRGSNAAGATSIRATVAAGTSIGAGCYFLFFNNNVVTGAGDQAYGVGITDDGGIAIFTNAAVIVDQAGMSAGSAYKEGATLAPTPVNANQSYERKPGGINGNSLDTDNNATDFLFNAASSNFQSSSAACLSATPARPSTWGRIKTMYR
jgi:hypothetical protein